jgi:hypothetical protein
VEASADGKLGIWLRDENELLEADSWPPDEFQRLRIAKGRDCAVVVVWNYPATDQSGRPRKLIVLSGSGGVGTEAAARAVVDQYRDLEPRDQEPVWGVVEVLYRKSAGKYYA